MTEQPNKGTPLYMESENSMDVQLRDITARRAQIKNDYIKAWLAANVPDEHLNADWLINNVRIVEKRTRGDGPLTYNYTWHLEFISKGTDSE